MFLLVIGIFVLWAFGFDTMWRFYQTEVDGTVISSTDRPFRGAPRYVTDYIVRSTDGREQRYTAGATDGSLRRGLPVGTVLKKERWSFSYEINGRRVWFSLGFYIPVLTLGAAAICAGAFRTISRRRKPNKSSAS